MILRPDRVAKGFDGVWPSVAAADAAAQRIVVAGDSAVKEAALAEAAARRAVMDSVAATQPPLRDSTGAIIPRPVYRPRPVARDSNGNIIRAGGDSTGTPSRPVTPQPTRRDSAPPLIRVNRDTTRRDTIPNRIPPGATR